MYETAIQDLIHIGGQPQMPYTFQWRQFCTLSKESLTSDEHPLVNQPLHHVPELLKKLETERTVSPNQRESQNHMEILQTVAEKRVLFLS